MKEQFIPYELAIELRNLGFDDYVFAFYWTDTKQLILDSPNYLGKHNGVHLQAPLWQQAFDWFREMHELIYNITFKDDNYKFSYGTINSATNLYMTQYPTYEEARLACLDKLISSVKCKNKA